MSYASGAAKSAFKKVTHCIFDLDGLLLGKIQYFRGYALLIKLMMIKCHNLQSTINNHVVSSYLQDTYRIAVVVTVPLIRYFLSGISSRKTFRTVDCILVQLMYIKR